MSVKGTKLKAKIIANSGLCLLPAAELPINYRRYEPDSGNLRRRILVPAIIPAQPGTFYI